MGTESSHFSSMRAPSPTRIADFRSVIHASTGFLNKMALQTGCPRCRVGRIMRTPPIRRDRGRRAGDATSLVTYREETWPPRLLSKLRSDLNVPAALQEGGSPSAGIRQAAPPPRFISGFRSPHRFARLADRRLTARQREAAEHGRAVPPAQVELISSLVEKQLRTNQLRSVFCSRLFRTPGVASR